MKDNESLKRLYEMGKEMCALAESMGYDEEGGEEMSEEYEGAEKDGFGPESSPIGSKKKMDMALALFDGK